MRDKERGPGWSDRIKSLLRLRHEIKVWIGRFFIIDKGDLPNVRYSKGTSFFDSAKSPIFPPLVRIGDQNGKQEPRDHVFVTSKNFICQIKNAHLVGVFATPLTHNRKIISEHMGGLREVALRHRPYRQIIQSLQKPEQRFPNAFSINSPYCHNFYHWFVDSLPCIYAFERYKEQSELACMLVVPGFLFDWQKRSLELLGYPEEGYVHNVFNHVQVDNLVVPSSPRSNGFDTPPLSFLLSWLKNRLLEARAPTSSVLPKLIHISRADSTKPTRIGNETEVVEALTDLGFTNILLKDFGLDDQISMFAKAEIVVATHGAGLTNLIYSERPKVLEIFPSGLFRRDYYYLSNQVRGNYMSMMARLQSDGSSTIDVYKLVRTIKSWI